MASITKYLDQLSKNIIRNMMIRDNKEPRELFFTDTLIKNNGKLIIMNKDYCESVKARIELNKK